MLRKTACPSWVNETEWNAYYYAECDAIRDHGWNARRDQFNRDFPVPYTGPITAEAGRYAALCDLMD